MPITTEILEWLRDAFAPVRREDGAHGVKLDYVAASYGVHENAPQRGRRLHTFHSVATMAAWLNRHAKVRKAAEILVDVSTIRAGLHPQTPFCDSVVCSLDRHPRALRWVNALNKPLSQQQFYRLIVTADEDLGDATNIDGAVLGRSSEFLAAEIAKMRIVRGGEYTAELDERGNYKIRGGTDTVDVSGKLPSRLVIRIPWFLDVCGESGPADEPWVLAEYELELFVDIDAETEPKNPTFRLTAPGLPMLRHEARRDAAAWLDDLLDDGFLVGLGAYHAEECQDFRERVETE